MTKGKKLLAMGTLVVAGGLGAYYANHSVEAGTGPAPIADIGSNVLPPTTGGDITKAIVYGVGSKEHVQKIKAIMDNDESYLSEAIIDSTDGLGPKSATGENIDIVTTEIENATKTSAVYQGEADAGGVTNGQVLELGVSSKTKIPELENIAGRFGITVSTIK